MNGDNVLNVKQLVVLGGGSAGLIAALTVKKIVPDLAVRVVHSVELGVIGVGEATTAVFPRHFFEYLKMDPLGFYLGAEPSWKLGIHFIWSTQPDGFRYTFQHEYKSKWPELTRNTGFYCNEETKWTGMVSALMAHNRVFPRKADGMPHFHKAHAFHIENVKLIGWLMAECQKIGVEFTEGKVAEVQKSPAGVGALVLESGEKVTGDLFVDASGFRSELLGKTMETDFISFSSSLFNDRAVVAGWARKKDEPVRPHTTAETMDSGWCWQIDHEHWINRGYVYSSRFISDDDALEEFRRKNPRIETKPWMVRFKSGRYKKHWVGNVVGVGNAVGFVEPLESTALQMICLESSTLADTLKDSLCAPPPSLIDVYNRYNSRQWDDIRDFLSVHFAFNRRLDTPYWKACREQTDLAGAAEIVRFYRENGPSLVSDAVLFDPNNSFGLEGYLALLTGQGVPHAKPWTPTPTEAKVWRERLVSYGQHAAQGFKVSECLDLIRTGKVRLS